MTESEKESLEPKAPELLRNLKWLYKEGLKNWKYVVTTVVILVTVPVSKRLYTMYSKTDVNVVKKTENANSIGIDKTIKPIEEKKAKNNNDSGDAPKTVPESFLQTPNPEIISPNESKNKQSTIIATQEATENTSLPNNRLVRLNDKLSIELVLIPDGSFIMGTDEGEPLERPDHNVIITKPFYISKYEITQSQFQAVMRHNPSFFKGNEYPVENVSWIEAMNFCATLGGEYRLPTEAEWEYACKAGINNTYNILNRDTIKQLGWCSYDGIWESAKSTKKVGSFNPNSFGLYDMHGNVWEWCFDRFGDYPNEQVEDPNGPLEGEYRVLRGGSWSNSPVYCTYTYRFKQSPDYKSKDIGFRIVSPIKKK